VSKWSEQGKRAKGTDDVSKRTKWAGGACEQGKGVEQASNRNERLE